MAAISTRHFDTFSDMVALLQTHDLDSRSSPKSASDPTHHEVAYRAANHSSVGGSKFKVVRIESNKGGQGIRIRQADPSARPF